MSGLMRINKAIAASGHCSRRRADELIASGVVAVNGATVTEMGTQVDPTIDTITINGKAIAAIAVEQSEFTYVLLHKPIQVVSTAYDPEGRPTVISILPPALQKLRLYPVGRLDFFSEGLILLTNDGELTHRLTHPRFHLPKKYIVTLREYPTAPMLTTMRKGMTLSEGETLGPVEAEIIADTPPTLQLTLHQGINRQIRRMCRDLGLTILSLQRVSVGPIELGDLPKGESRPLSSREVKALYNAVHLPNKK